ncbi:MAG: tetratricopeptide repeat protein, partial [Lysobacterales bacterium]
MGSNQSGSLVSEQLQQVQALLRSGATRSALELLNRLESSHPGQVEALALRGAALSKLGKDEEAEQALRKAAELQPKSKRAAGDHAGVLLKLGRPDEALAVLVDQLPPAETQARGPEDAAFNFNLGRAYKACGRAADAVLPLQQTLVVKPRHYAALVTLGDVYKALGDPQQAAGCFRRALEINPANGAAWWSLSNLKAGSFSDAEFGALQQMALQATASEQQVFFDFALASGFDQRHELEAAFAHYFAGNRRKRQLQKPRPWDRD